MSKVKVSASVFAMLAALTVGCAFAQEESAREGSPLAYTEDGRQVFLPGYFERFGPQTATDMLRNVPGFQIREGDDRRGFGQGGFNVLINGARVSGKSTNPVSILSQTSAEAVVRIEIVDGATLGISGLSGQVANVVLNQEKTTGNWEYNPQFRKGLTSRLLSGSVSVSGKRNNVTYTVGLENNSRRNGAWGDEFVTNAAGERLERRYEEIEPKGEQPELTVTLGHKSEAGNEANFNMKLGVFDFENSIFSEYYPLMPMDPLELRRFNEAEDEWNSEFGADYAFDFLGGRLKLIGFNYRENSDYWQTVVSHEGDNYLGGDRYEQETYEGESILRGEQSWDYGEGRSFELAGEVAYNFVDNEAALYTLAEDGSQTEIDFDGADSKVEERRGEVSATYNFPLGEKLALQSSLAIEYSELEQSGEFANKRSFTRPKGFVSATYKLSEKTELRGRVEREVGQLDFFAFTSSINLESENGQEGNTDLVPQQSWIYEAAIERTFDDESKITLSIVHEEIEDIVQQIPIGDGDGPGNVPSATSTRLQLNGTQMLTNYGIKGGEITYDFRLRDSEIADPFTGDIRRLNEQTKWFYRIEYRHDIPDTDYAYGASIEDFKLSPVYRRSQISQFSQSKPTIEIYAEHKDFFGATAQVYVFNILNYTEDFTRDLYAGSRADSTFVVREAREWAFNPIVGVNLSGTF
ncbi:TonB-dependent receptor plug domain-containing protein [Parvularcula flava]|uniref:TonB-dependent receptor n=1 Tax=Aquisalinus luteolus TaxID=1566827 RepID=A0A8J3ETS2_9PROT|nr:TonB-dependent receptor plug domain-containing protein [Aquisalinus luteolus]NHK27258.1 TonB-dependent receptor plug domain-containing protein [Aquisalinus luteolus]GGH94890.1 TonB-dependent receptor [Aquisalinus luteolus]